MAAKKRVATVQSHEVAHMWYVSASLLLSAFCLLPSAFCPRRLDERMEGGLIGMCVVVKVWGYHDDGVVELFVFERRCIFLPASHLTAECDLTLMCAVV